jgi:hypothetical protein
VVIAAVSACALILVAAGVTRVVHASSEPDRVARATVTPGPSTSAATTAASGAESASTAAAPTAQSAPQAGTIHLERALPPRWVWLDGKRLSSRNEVVACGSHTIKVGHGKAHPIDVPCGGDVSVAH